MSERLDTYFGTQEWRRWFRDYIVRVGVVEDDRRVYEKGPPFRTDHYGSVWRSDKRPVHLAEPVLRQPSLQGYSFPDPDRFFTPGWERGVRAAIAKNPDCFTVLYPGFGLFERGWALRVFLGLQG